MLPQCELMTICMLFDEKRECVLIQNRRKKSWQGVAFPGGHVEEGESFMECIIREMQEETGLRIHDVHLCGLVHWEHEITRNRSIIACYRAYAYEGTLRTDCEEGTHEWVAFDTLHSRELAPWLDQQLTVFEQENVSEMFYVYNDDAVSPPRVLSSDSDLIEGE